MSGRAGDEGGRGAGQAPVQEIWDERREYTVEELCRVCRLEPDRLVEYVAHGVVGGDGARERFAWVEVHRLVRAVRVRRELEVELPDLALVMDLLDTIESQRRELDVLRRHRTP